MRRYASDICKIKNLRDLINQYSLTIIEDIQREPNCKFAQIFLRTPSTLDDYQSYIVRIVAIIDELGPQEVTYEKDNYLSMYWD